MHAPDARPGWGDRARTRSGARRGAPIVLFVMPFDPNLPQEETLADAAQMREQLNSLKAMIDAQAAQIAAWQAQLNALPSGPPGPPGQDGAPGVGVIPAGDWWAGSSYTPGNVVAYQGLVYIALTQPSGAPPDVDAAWRLLSVPGPAGANGDVTQAALLAETAGNVDGVAPLDAGQFSTGESQIMVGKVNEVLGKLQRQG